MDNKRFAYNSLILPALFFSSFFATAEVLAKDSPTALTSASWADSTQIVDRAKSYYQSQEYHQAAPLWQQAAELFAKKNDRLNEAMALSNLSLTYQQLGNWEGASRAMESSISLLDGQSHNQAELSVFAQTLDIKGSLQRDLGQLENALNTWEKAGKIYSKLNRSQEFNQNLINQAQVLQDLGFLPRSCQTLLKVFALRGDGCNLSNETIDVLLKQSLSPVQIRASIALGGLLRYTGNLQKSQQVLTAILESVKGSLEEEESKVLLNLATTEYSLFKRAEDLKQRREARNYKEKVIAYYQQASNSKSAYVQTQAMVNLFSFFVETQDWQEARALLPKINEQLADLPVTRKTIYTRIGFARNLVCLLEQKANCLTQQSLSGLNSNNLEESLKILENTLEQAEKIEDLRSQSYVLGNLGLLYQLQGDINLAQETMEKALNIAHQIRADDISYQWYWQLARIAEGKGDRRDSLAQYNQAFTLLNKLRFDLVNLGPEVQFSFRESVEPLYREYVDLLLTGTPKENEMKKAREVMEALKIAELNNFFRDNCLEGEVVRDNLVEQLDPNAAVLYPIILRDRVEVIASIPGQPLRNYKTYLKQVESEQELREILNTISSVYVKEPPRELLKKWHDILIAPIATELQEKQITTLVFVADSLLRNIPLSALYDGEKYLLEKYSIAIAPSLKLIKPRPLTEETLEVLAAGLTEARQGFSPLPGVQQELSNITEEVTREVLLLNDSFNQPNFEKQFANSSFPIIHLATHGEFNSTAENTFVLAWDDKINVYKLDELLRRQDRRKKPIELLVLSACETAKGDDRSALGLAGVAVRAGARSTIASLWQVSDESTQILMTRLYQELSLSEQKGGEKISKAEALRRAQLSVLKNEKFSNPFFWSAFILVGNWF
jgi:CHAT domain-containing protein